MGNICGHCWSVPPILKGSTLESGFLPTNLPLEQKHHQHQSPLERSQYIVEYYANVNEPSKAQHMKRKQHKKIIKRKCLSACSCKNLVLCQSSAAFGKSFPNILGSDDLFPKSISVLQKLHIHVISFVNTVFIQPQHQHLKND